MLELAAASDYAQSPTLTTAQLRLFRPSPAATPNACALPGRRPYG
jgi:hypothetical protein